MAEYEMHIDGKKIIVKDEQLKRYTMGKQIEVEIDGRRVWIQEHLLDDAIKLGATRQRRIVKPVPKELFVKEILRSEIEIKPPVVTQIPVRPIMINRLPEMKEEKKHEAPVKSKAK
jgi:hypothetical protein